MTVEQAIFNQIMAKAVDTKKIYPNMDAETIAKLACSEIQGHEDYDFVVFQVVMNLVNLDR